MKVAIDILLLQSPLFMLVSLIIAGLITWSFTPIFYALMFYTLGLASNRMLKYICAVVFPNSVHIHRPTQCPLPEQGTGRCEQCHILPIWGAPLDGDQMLGMPSGHAQSMVMIATAWTLFASVYLQDTMHRYLTSVFFWLWAGAVMFQRVHSRCHTIEQVAMGAVIGASFGVFTHIIAGKNILA